MRTGTHLEDLKDMTCLSLIPCLISWHFVHDNICINGMLAQKAHTVCHFFFFFMVHKGQTILTTSNSLGLHSYGNSSQVAMGPYSAWWWKKNEVTQKLQPEITHMVQHRTTHYTVPTYRWPSYTNRAWPGFCIIPLCLHNGEKIIHSYLFPKPSELDQQKLHWHVIVITLLDNSNV